MRKLDKWISYYPLQVWMKKFEGAPLVKAECNFIGG